MARWVKFPLPARQDCWFRLLHRIASLSFGFHIVDFSKSPTSCSHLILWMQQNFTILLAEPPRNLAEVIAATPSKESAILDRQRDLVQRFVDKKLLAFTFVHNLLWEYTKEVRM